MSEHAYQLHILRDRDGEEGIADAVLRWWARLVGDESLLGRYERGALPTAARAVLRRAVSPDDALLSEGFRALWNDELPFTRRSTRDMRAWACVASVLAVVREHDESEPFAAAMGREAAPHARKPRVSELRFQQLLRSDDLDDLLRRARRIVHLLGRRVNVVSLADDLLHWHREKGGDFAPRPDRRLAVRWADAYFTEVNEYQAGRREE